MVDNLHIRPLLTQSETLLLEKTRATLKELRFRGRILVKSHASTFIDPNLVDLEHRKCLLEDIVTLSIIDKIEKGKIVLAIIDNTSPCAHNTKELFEKFGIPAIPTTSHDIEELIRSELNNPRSTINTRNITNPQEKWVLSVTSLSVGHRYNAKLKIALEREPHIKKMIDGACTERRSNILIFHEVAISTIISTDEKFLQAPEIDIEYLKKSRLDVLITGPSPAYIPLLAIEFDGPCHAKNSKKDKDLKKEKILNLARIPLLRISFHDAPSQDRSNISNRIKHADKEKLLQRLISRCVGLRFQDEVVFYNKLKASISKARHSIKPGDIGSILDTIEEVSSECQLDKYVDQIQREHELDPQSRIETRDRGGIFDDFQYHTDETHGVGCSVNIRHRVTDETIMSLHSPVVHYQCIGLNDFDFRRILEEELRIWLIDKASEKLVQKSAKIVPLDHHQQTNDTSGA